MNLLNGMFIFWAGCLVGFIFSRLLLMAFKDYGGTIVIDRDELGGKTIYSLILEDNPEILEELDEVIFKIVISEKSFNLNNRM